jgi:hypothetical protein
MNRFNNPLKNVRVASPCNVDWNQMLGDDRARFCGQCNLNVYNLSDMTRSEAELLIGNKEGRLCVRYYKRKDGSIITRDCPVGLRAIRRRMSYIARAVSSATLSFFAGLGVFGIVSRLSPNPPIQGQIMGVVAINPPVISIQPPITVPPATMDELGELVVVPPKKKKATRAR